MKPSVKTWSGIAATHKTIRNPRSYEVIILRFLILGGVFSVFQFLWWYADSDFVGYPVLYWLLAFSLGYKLLHLAYEWYYFGAIGKAPPWTAPGNHWKVDMLTTFVPGEPYEVVEKTLRAMVRVRYPHTTYLCDEGDDPYLKKLCAELGVVHVYRGADKTGAKAGNINFALRHYATGDICVILDPDHEPVPEFLDRTLPYFEDPKTGYVQCIQGYSNAGQSLIAKGAAEQTYLFYGPMMMGMNRYGTVQAIGANCTFRRTALDSIGGHATGLCEDMHTSMKLHAKKWTSVYVPELLTRGLVPSSLSAFYKQQLKWSRGSFELLFEVFPKLFGSFTWRQRIHYFLTPLYFLGGLVVLLDLSIPVVSLTTSQVPLLINLWDFFLHALPVLLSVTVIRHYAQHFLLEQHERGFHIIGSILRMGTWWIHLLGLVYAIFRIKIPYIPTPKENEVANEWKICIPNLFVIVLSTAATGYGLYRDWTPFAWLMAGFAGVNIFLLGLAVLSGQQKWISRLFHSKFSILRRYWFNFRHRVLYKFFQHDGVVILFTCLAFGLSAAHIIKTGMPQTLASVDEIPDTKKSPWLLTAGAYIPSTVNDTGNGKHKKVAAFRLREENPGNALRKIAGMLSYCRQTGQLPLIRLDTITATAADTAWTQRLALLLREYQHPLILHWNSGCAGSDSLLIASHRQMQNVFDAHGAGNVSWAGAVSADSLQQRRYRPPAVVDIFLLHLQGADYPNIARLLDSLPSNHPVLLYTDSIAQADLFDRQVLRLRLDNKPVLGWLDRAQFREKFPNPANHDSVYAGNINPGAVARPVHDKSHRSIRFDSVAGQYEWVVEGKPFYMKGVVYNPEHDWRDGSWPPTRRQLEKDFSLIKAMGANAIIREGHSVYDRNILNLAAEHGLKVLFTFWCEPEIDYFADTIKTGRLKKEILTLVREYRDHPALLAWMAGNGTWNGLSDHFHQPYLTQARLAYVEWLEQVIGEIKQIDTLRPVIKSITGNREFFGALDDLQLAAPSVDLIAFSAGTLEQLETFDRAMRNWKGGQPYLISGFGGKSLWDTLVSGAGRNEILPEKSSFEKARLYAKLWRHGIENKRAANFGGAAYCWRDRMEGTATMSGITDYRGRLKPAYFTLKQLWTGTPQAFPLADLWLKCEVFFENNDNFFIFSALTPNNSTPGLTYQWYICREEYLERVEEVNINYEKLGARRFYLLSNYYEHVRRKFTPLSKGAQIKLLTKRADALQRIYLHISDEQGHVVTASFPVHPERLIQRTQ